VNPGGSHGIVRNCTVSLASPARTWLLLLSPVIVVIIVIIIVVIVLYHYFRN
jgi:hypothetical protein